MQVNSGPKISNLKFEARVEARAQGQTFCVHLNATDNIKFSQNMGRSSADEKRLPEMLCNVNLKFRVLKSESKTKSADLDCRER